MVVVQQESLDQAANLLGGAAQLCVALNVSAEQHTDRSRGILVTAVIGLSANTTYALGMS